VEQEVAAARATLHADSDRIASQIIKSILQSAGFGPVSVVGGRR
jgi:hypothetical protein